MYIPRSHSHSIHLDFEVRDAERGGIPIEVRSSVFNHILISSNPFTSNCLKKLMKTLNPHMQSQVQDCLCISSVLSFKVFPYCIVLYLNTCYSAPTRFLFRGAPDYCADAESEFHAEAHEQLRVKELPRVPTRRL